MPLQSSRIVVTGAREYNDIVAGFSGIIDTLRQYFVYRASATIAGPGSNAQTGIRLQIEIVDDDVPLCTCHCKSTTRLGLAKREHGCHCMHSSVRMEQGVGCQQMSSVVLWCKFYELWHIARS